MDAASRRFVLTMKYQIADARRVKTAVSDDDGTHNGPHRVQPVGVESPIPDGVVSQTPLDHGSRFVPTDDVLRRGGKAGYEGVDGLVVR